MLRFNVRPGALGFGDSGSSIGIGFGEPELDANAALTELDKGLRSTKIGEQCEAIVRFPALFEKYPFPILINSAFLKLADVFRTGSNFLRLWVLRVCEQSERHLDKILNVDEFIRRIFSVIHSNDPIARALTLRTLGSLSGLIPERKPVHHSIRVGLDSHDLVEVAAAIYAASCFAKKSKTFGTTMCTKISAMVQRLSTPIDLKLRLIPIFQYMHHDVATASIVRKLCQELLLSYPSEQFVITTLHTLTQLAAASISDLTEQVSFLLTNLDDSRPKVKLGVLKDLNFLGEKGGHLWEPAHISILINSIMNHYSERMGTNDYNRLDSDIIYTTLDVINSLTSSSAILNFVSSPETPLWRLLDASIQSSDIKIVLKAIQIGTSIIVSWKSTEERLSEAGITLVGMIRVGMESLLKTMCCSNVLADVEDDDKEQIVKDLKTTFVYGTSLCRSSPGFCDWFSRIMVELLLQNALAIEKRNIVCQTLGNICSFSPKTIQGVLPKIVATLQKWDLTRLESEKNNVTVIVAIILQAHHGYALQTSMMDFIQHVIRNSNLWVSYRIARSSFRFGQPELAAFALEGTSSRVSSENFHFWLSALHSIAAGEDILSKADKHPLLQTRLTLASNLYLQAVTSLKAASSPAVSLMFQTDYVKLRAEMLVAFRTFLVSCGNLQFSPPPAIAPNIVCTGNKDPLLASGRIVSQLRKSVREFYNLSEAYDRLYHTAFDSDPESLLNVQILKQVCQLVGRSIEKVVVSSDQPSIGIGDQAFSFCFDFDKMDFSNSTTLIHTCKQAVEVLKVLETLPSKVVSQQHVDTLKESARLLVETPIAYPRFFFQHLQNTRVKIAVSPQPRAPGESVALTMGNNLALKVEGVIEQNFAGVKEGVASKKCFRKAKEIRITVVATPPAPNVRPLVHGMDVNKLNQDPIVISKEVVPHRDFFTVQFLLALWQSGITTVTVEASIVDSDGRHWMTGPKTSLSVRVFEEPSSKVQTPSAGTLSSRPVGSSSGSGIPQGISSKPRI